MILNDAFTSGISLNRQHWIIYQEKAGTIRCLNFEKQDVVILSSSHSFRVDKIAA